MTISERLKTKSTLLCTAVCFAGVLVTACTETTAPILDAQTRLSGATLTDSQRAYDVQHYTLDIGVYPDTKRIEGSLAVRFDVLQDMSEFDLDLDPRMGVSVVSLGGTPLAFEHDDNKISVKFAESLKAGSENTITVEYGGKPHIGLAPPWDGGLVWSTTLDGLPWVATAVQGIGCDIWWPCKDYYGDKPDDGMDIIVSVPESVKVATNGVLIDQSDVVNGRHSFHWQTRHPMTGYAVALNIGPYTRLQDSYAGINGATIPIEFWVLPEDEEKARSLIATDVKPHMEFFEKLLGPYPWGDEKVGFVQTPHLGMEHQTINAYGASFEDNDYGFDGLLHHELAHEWFGNVMTHANASDAWLHEGYASHMQAEYARRTVGSMAYADSLFSAYTGSEHCDAIVDSSKSNVEDFLGNGDIYTKGSWLIHMLRNYMGDDAFWAGTRELLYGTATPWDLEYPIKSIYRSTEDFINIMSAQAGEDVRWIVEAYLLAADIPTLETTRTDTGLSLSWVVPDGRPFPMPVTVSVDGQMIVVTMSDGSGQLDVPENADIIVDPEMKVLRRMPLIGDCEQREEADTARIEARHAKMAEEYRWQRD